VCNTKNVPQSNLTSRPVPVNFISSATSQMDFHYKSWLRRIGSPSGASDRGRPGFFIVLKTLPCSGIIWSASGSCRATLYLLWHICWALRTYVFETARLGMHACIHAVSMPDYRPWQHGNFLCLFPGFLDTADSGLVSAQTERRKGGFQAQGDGIFLLFWWQQDSKKERIGRKARTKEPSPRQILKFVRPIA
jgi:hypothetical protein